MSGKLSLLITLLLTALVFTGCAGSGSNDEHLRTQLEIRQFQTRSYATTDTKMVIKAVLNVLQDDGYIVNNAVPEIGLYTATKKVDIGKTDSKLLKGVMSMYQIKWKKTSMVECTINISKHGDSTRVRANFILTLLDNVDAPVKTEHIRSEEFYREFFGKVDKGIFLEDQKL